MQNTDNPAFEEYYGAIFGQRWAGLRESLLVPAQTIPYRDGLVKPYMMDRASVLAALSLRLPLEGIILDACAAPGGKSLVLASLMEKGVRLLSNELSGDRRRRLTNVLDEHLESETRMRVTVSGFDAGAQGGKKGEWNRFDAILLDAPCSSERHVIQSEKALAQWTSGRPRSLASRQWSLLSAAFLLLKPGGSLVYATCAISPEENDGPSGRLLEKYGQNAKIDEPDFSGGEFLPWRTPAEFQGEKTKYGTLILPDASGGAGPMYIARFRKAV